MLREYPEHSHSKSRDIPASYFDSISLIVTYTVIVAGNMQIVAHLDAKHNLRRNAFGLGFETSRRLNRQARLRWK